MNLFEKKAWELKVIDDRGHQFFIQDLMDFDDIVRSSGKIMPGNRIYVPDRAVRRSLSSFIFCSTTHTCISGSSQYKIIAL